VEAEAGDAVSTPVGAPNPACAIRGEAIRKTFILFSQFDEQTMVGERSLWMLVEGPDAAREGIHMVW